MAEALRLFLRSLAVAALVVAITVFVQAALAPNRADLGQVERSHPQLTLRQHTAHYLSNRYRLTVDDPSRDMVVLTSGQWGLPTTVLASDHYILVFTARQPSRRADIYRLDVTTSPAGVPVRFGYLRQLTATDEVEETNLVARGSRVAFSAYQRGRHDSLVVLDLAGEPPETTVGWPWELRFLNALTNLQRDGQLQGIARTQYYFGLPPAHLALEFMEDGLLSVRCANHSRTLLDLAGPDESVEQACGLIPVRQPKIADPFIFQAVNLVRNLPFIGPDRMAVLQRIAFDLLDTLRRYHLFTMPSLQGEPPDEERVFVKLRPLPESIGAGLGLLRGEDQLRGRLPPPRIQAMIPDRPPRDGQWFPVERGVSTAPDGVPFFYQARLRVDPDRPEAEIHFVVWDPERVRLGIVAGTEEPIPTTSGLGTGLVPRRAGEIDRLIGAFNGGFQSVHGTHGMIVEGLVLVPTIPDVATVATLEGDRVAMGRWSASWQPPGDLVSLRQNLPPLVEGSVANPDQRLRWGWAPGQSRFVVGNPLTVRTALCRLQNGALAYAYGNFLDGQRLAQALVAAGCDFGIHLDMNPGHTGFEFYQVFDQRGDQYEARKLYSGLPLVRHPRYVRQDNRDFFYLVSRPHPLEDALPASCPDTSPIPYRRLTSTGQELDRELASLLAVPVATTLTDRPLCDQPERVVEVVRIPLANVRARLTFYRQAADEARLLGDQGEFLIPLVTQEVEGRLGIQADGRLNFQGEGVESIPLPMLDPAHPLIPEGQGMVMGVDGRQDLFLVASADPQALAATLVRLELDQSFWLAREGETTFPEILFGDGRVRTLPSGGQRSMPAGFVLWLDFVPPAPLSLPLDAVLGHSAADQPTPAEGGLDAHDRRP